MNSVIHGGLVGGFIIGSMLLGRLSAGAPILSRRLGLLAAVVLSGTLLGAAGSATTTQPSEPGLQYFLAYGLVISLLLAAAMMLRQSHQRRKLRATNKRVVLAIGAHPDDIEFGCGAALMRYRQDGYETHGLVLSRGENGISATAGAPYGLREKEARKAARLMALDSLTVLNFPDRGLTSRREQIKQAIEDCVRRFRPDVVFTHSRADLHSDHRIVFNATIEASRHVPTILCYENPNTPAEFRPNFFIDIAGCLEGKIAALKCHASQARKPYFRPELIRSIARIRGNQAKVRFAEGFEVIRARLGAV